MYFDGTSNLIFDIDSNNEESHILNEMIKNRDTTTLNKIITQILEYL